MPHDQKYWSQREGRVVDSVYLLDRCVRITADGAVFDTAFHGRPATIRISVHSARRAQWDQAAELAHPSLSPILSTGEDKLENQHVVYVVAERADDNLADVLNERPLTFDETLDTLKPIIAGLRYLESQNLVHADLTPAGVLAFGEQIRIAGDDLVAMDDAKARAQSRAVGALIEKMMGSRPKADPLASIVKNCLRTSAAPWTLAQIESCLQGEKVVESTQPPQSRTVGRTWIYITGAVATVALAAFFLRPSGDTPPKPAEPAPETAPVVEFKPAPKAEKPSPVGKSGSTREPAVVTSPPEPAPAKTVTSMDGITQVMPEIPAAARNTINGRVRINIRVQTDGTGRVTQATLMPPGASKYFTDRVLAAARSWKFPPESSARTWLLRFELSRQQTNVSVAKSD